MIIDLKGHVLILKHPKLSELLLKAQNDFLMPFSVSDEGDSFQLSHPLSVAERLRYKWLYARKASESKLKEKPAPTPEDDGPGPAVA
jgi:hypothetical protein